MNRCTFSVGQKVFFHRESGSGPHERSDTNIHTVMSVEYVTDNRKVYVPSTGGRAGDYVLARALHGQIVTLENEVVVSGFFLKPAPKS